MAEFQKFRSALGGFNREDVVHYIEYINNKHAAQLNQLKNEIQALQDELAEQRQDDQEKAEVDAQLSTAQERIAELEQELEQARKQAQNPVAPVVVQAPQSIITTDELEAYRRAERAERRAAERVAQMYDQANAALADAALRADSAATQVSQFADTLNLQVQQLLGAVASGKNVLQDAAAAMYAVRPQGDEE